MASRSRRNTLASLVALAVAVAIYALDLRTDSAPGSFAPSEGVAPEATPSGARATSAIARLYQTRRSGVMVDAEGHVEKELSDDRDGSRHQRFIVRVSDGHTVLVAHNIDLAQRVPLREGDRVRVRGQYEWNDRGGVLHWTHHDPDGRHAEGFVEHRGRRYE